MPHRKWNASQDVAFIVRMKDGTEFRMLIDKFTLRDGDQVARTIARKYQFVRMIPKGEIADVHRAPLSSEPD
jgi:hypothetical protein